MKTRDQLITDALEKAGALGLNETPTANQITRAASALSSLLKTFNTFGMPIWKLKQYSFAMSLFTDGYAEMGTAGDLVTTSLPLKMISAQRFDSIAETTIDLNVYTRTEFFTIPSTLIEGIPTQIYFKPGTAFAEVHLWPRPNAYAVANMTLLIDVQEALDAVGSSTTTPSFPDEWEEAIIYNLADRLAPNYGLPIQERQLLNKEAKMRLDEVLGFSNEEGSVYIQPATRIA